MNESQNRPTTPVFRFAVLLGVLLVAIVSLFSRVAFVDAQRRGTNSALQRAPSDRIVEPASGLNTVNLENYKFLFSFPHDDIVTCAAFSHDGRLLATGSEKGTIIVIDLATKKQRVIENLHPLGNGVSAISFSQDDQLLLTSGSGSRNSKNTGLINILQTDDYSVIETLDGHSGRSVDFLRISRDKNWLISADDTKINIWNVKEKRVQRTFPRLDSALTFDGERTLVLGVGNISNKPASEPFGRLRDGSIAFVDILEGKATRMIDTVSPQIVRGIALTRENAALVVLAQTNSGYVVHVIDGRNDRILKSISITPYKPEPGWRLVGAPHINFELTKNYPIVVYNDRRVTYLIDYNSGKIAGFDHRSMIGFTFNQTGERFAVLGGITNQALTGIPEQHYWTVSVFSFDPQRATK